MNTNLTRSEAMSLRGVQREFRTDDGSVVLYQGDCNEIMPQLEDGSVDHVIADPPYDQRTHERARSLKNGGSDIAIDFSHLSNMQHVGEFLRISRRWVIAFCALEQLGEYKVAAGDAAWIRGGLWDRPDGTPQISGDRPGQGGEGIAIMHAPRTKKRWNAGGKRGTWRCGVDRSAVDHPTCKPLKLMCELVADFTEFGDLVADFYMGSGTTGVACIQNGRRFFGIEKEPRYFDVAVSRIREAIARTSLLEAAPKITQRSFTEAT